MGSEVTEAATLQLEALGLIKISEDGEKLYLTIAGRKRAWAILKKLPMDERLLVVLLAGEAAFQCAESEE